MSEIEVARREDGAETKTARVDRLGPPLLTVDEVAAHLRCSVEMVYKLRRPEG